MHLLL